MYKQSGLGSGKPIAVWPSYCLLPHDLYTNALEVFGYGSGSEGRRFDSSAGRAVNPFGMDRVGDPRPIPIVVPEFTDSNDWAAIADPSMLSVIQMTYAQDPSGNNHPMPEFFTVTSPNSGLVFTNDTLPVKIRDWFAYGVSGYRRYYQGVM